MNEPVIEQGTFRVHKFRMLNKNFWRSLKHSQFYFPRPEQLNDPADCQIDLVKAFHIARAGMAANHSARHEEAFLNLMSSFKQAASMCGVYSFSAGKIDSAESRLFWAHYAANHTGVCLTFDIPEDFISQQMVGCAPVDYTTKSLFAALSKLDLSRGQDFETDIKPIITAYLTTKSPEWEYEHEARIVSDKAGPKYFDRSWLRQICFGLRTSDAHRERLKEIAKSYPNCNLAEAVHADDDLFSIKLQLAQ